MDVHIGTSCSWKINFKKFYTSLRIPFVHEEETKTNCLSHCVTSKHPYTACRPRDEFLSVAVQSGLCAAPTLCLDERCVLMRAIWEFNEARWEWAWSYGCLLMWDVLRGFLLLCLYELDTFLWYSATDSLHMYCEWYFVICFSKKCTLVELPATLTWTVS